MYKQGMHSDMSQNYTLTERFHDIHHFTSSFHDSCWSAPQDRQVRGSSKHPPTMPPLRIFVLPLYIDLCLEITMNIFQAVMISFKYSKLFVFIKHHEYEITLLESNINIKATLLVFKILNIFAVLIHTYYSRHARVPKYKW